MRELMIDEVKLVSGGCGSDGDNTDRDNENQGYRDPRGYKQQVAIRWDDDRNTQIVDIMFTQNGSFEVMEVDFSISRMQVTAGVVISGYRDYDRDGLADRFQRGRFLPSC